MPRGRQPFLLPLALALTFSIAAVQAADPADKDAAAQESEARQPLTPEQLDRLVAEGLGETPLTAPVADEQFLRRATLDLLGRQPTPEELEAFVADASPEKRSQLIDRLLASEEFGVNWANYWSDAIGYRVPQPELTFLNYTTFKGWLGLKLNQNSPWHEVVREMLTATGKVKENPAATFVGFHEGNATRLASETARLFLGLNIQCAQCHDHPFENWKQDEYHRMAAFFARTEAKLPWNDSDQIVVKDRGKGEHRMPADPGKQGKVMTPSFLDGEEFKLDTPDEERRKFLANSVASADNPWFAKAYVNRIWARLMGEGFCEPVDNIGETQTVTLPQVHAAVAKHFAAGGFDVKDLFRLVMNTQAYERRLPSKGKNDEAKSFAARPAKLRGDEVFASLVTAVGLPNVTPPAVKASKGVRFPPPPKSTRDIVAEAFGFDPSLRAADVPRTMPQVMLLMNNEQIQAQVNADPESGTHLSKLLASEKEDRTVVISLFESVLARQPSEKETDIALEHVRSVGQRGEAFEDVLWGLLNSAEFTTRR